MASVPNTATFSLTDVNVVLGQTNLVSCLAVAVDWCFNPAYKGSKNSLLNFRDYNTARIPVVTMTGLENNGGSASFNLVSNGPITMTYTLTADSATTRSATLSLGGSVVNTCSTGTAKHGTKTGAITFASASTQSFTLSVGVSGGGSGSGAFSLTNGVYVSVYI